MTPERWQQIERLYHEALARAASERGAFLASACGGDEMLRREVESLLAQPVSADGPLDGAAAALLSDVATLLAAGTRIGVYVVQGLLDKGGMGEVYRAIDTKLKREVALKVLPSSVAGDAGRLARFQREAEVLASLNHPNIATVHGLEEAGTIRAIVMELVDGETLAARVARAGALPLDDVLSIGRQIAEALDAAHEKGIVHRDLKPANVIVSRGGTVKVLDFGLAKMQPAGDTATGAHTFTVEATREGVVLGTPTYMSPEQARGQAVDRRTDIWAFGCVLYEMLTGRAPFAGGTVTDTLAAVLDREPDWGALSSRAPADLVHLLKRCLEKDSGQRLRDISTAIEMMRGKPVAAVPPPASPASRWIRPVAMAGVLIVASGLAIWAPWRSGTSTREAVRFEVGPTENTAFTVGGAMTVSPDGHWLAFPARGEDGITRFWLRSLDAVDVRALPGTEAGALPAPVSWSWDSRFLLFGANDRLTKIDIHGGTPQALTVDVFGGLNGAAWNRDGEIVLGRLRSGPLLRIAASGGTATPVTALGEGETHHRWPQFLPDGRRFLYLRVSSDPGTMGVYVGSLDTRPDAQSRVRVLASDRQAYYAASPDGGPGHLIFMRESALMAQPFDPDTLALSGDPVAIAEGVDSFPLATYGLFSVSETGTVVYRGGIASRLTPTWFGLQGRPEGTLGERGEYANPAASPDGARVAVARGPSANRDIWILDVARGTSTRFTFDSASDDNPVWSPDGQSIVFSSNRLGQRDLYLKPADGSADERLLFKSNESKVPTSWSSDGGSLLFTTISAKTGDDVWALPMQGEPTPIPIVQAPFQESNARFSPNGRWISYRSNESGTNEIYVRPFTPQDGADTIGARRLVSTGTGWHSRWQPDGKKLFYATMGSQQTVMEVDIDASAGFRAGTPRSLFAGPPSILDYGWDIAPDGKRFLFLATPGDGRTIPFTVMINWAAALKK